MTSLENASTYDQPDQATPEIPQHRIASPESNKSTPRESEQFQAPGLAQVDNHESVQAVGHNMRETEGRETSSLAEQSLRSEESGGQPSDNGSLKQYIANTATILHSLPVIPDFNFGPLQLGRENDESRPRSASGKSKIVDFDKIHAKQFEMMRPITELSSRKSRPPSPSTGPTYTSEQPSKRSQSPNPSARRPSPSVLSSSRPDTADTQPRRPPTPDRITALAMPKQSKLSEALTADSSKTTQRPSSASGSRPRTSQTPTKRAATPQGVSKPSTLPNRVPKHDSQSMDTTETGPVTVTNKPVLSRSRPGSTSDIRLKKQMGLPNSPLNSSGNLSSLDSSS